MPLMDDQSDKRTVSAHFVQTLVAFWGKDLQPPHLATARSLLIQILRNNQLGAAGGLGKRHSPALKWISACFLVDKKEIYI